MRRSDTLNRCNSDMSVNSLQTGKAMITAVSVSAIVKLMFTSSWFITMWYTCWIGSTLMSGIMWKMKMKVSTKKPFSKKRRRASLLRSVEMRL